MKLKNKVAIVTGGGGGLGRAMCLEFVSQGATVVVADIDSNSANETVRLINNEGGRSVSAEVDLTDASMIDQMISTTLDQFGKIDILINSSFAAQIRQVSLDITR